ncbi:hypothetical protein [Sphingomonas sp. UNC305MFCol5.2]|uniref:hypothetical protein n=1 Tax=Sphingomonas sp. UNC305MFCol5.2 TaxID=1449076 RepID=UPI0004A2FE65|nr:hypothetical protein [Sphingomonas sp. UNC305MFCol5.2]
MTTTKITAAQASAALAQISADLVQAEQDLALLERLKSAGDRVKRLTADRAKAVGDRDTALAVERKAREDARFKDLSDLRVVEVGKTDEGVLRSAWTINYTRIAYDMDSGRNVPQPVAISGFGGLPDNVFALLIEQHPDRIPAKIMALAPNDPKEAFARYFRGLTRGFIAA